MKTYFSRLLDYDRYANLILLNTILDAGTPEKPVQLMAHLLVTQQAWLSRCKKEIRKIIVFPDWKADIFKAMIEENHQQWIAFVNGVTDFDETIHYTNSTGSHYGNTITDITTHMLNHGTHHRAQIGQHLKLAGIDELPSTDYIFYIRQNQA